MKIKLFPSLPRYESRKDSGLGWIGEIPAHWELKRLKFLVSLNPDSLAENTLPSFEMEYVDIGSVSYEKGIEKTEFFLFGNSPSRARRLAKEGDTVISTVRTYLKAIAYINSKKYNFVYSTGFAVLRPNGTLNPKFLTSFVWSNAFTNQVQDESKGMSYPAINSTDLSNLFVAVPSLPEQTAIATFLDRKTAQIDRAVAIKEKQIALLRERKQILIQNAVTRGLDPDVPMRDSGVEWIGEIPGHWEVRRLKAFIKKLESGVSVNGYDSECAQADEIGVLKTSAVFQFQFDPKENKKVFKSELRRVACPVRKGEIIISRMNTPDLVGASGYVNKDFENLFLPDRLWQTILNGEFTMDAKWLSNVLICQGMRNCLKSIAIGSSPSMKNISKIDFLNIKIGVPPEKEQTAIVAHIETQSQKIDHAIALQQQQIEKLKEYKATLIDSAVTGKIRVPMLTEPIPEFQN